MFSKRMAARREAEARARGENVDYLTRDIPNEFRTKLWYALQDLANVLDAGDQGMYERVLNGLWARLVREYGWVRLSKPSAEELVPRQDLGLFVVRDADAEHIMDVIEHAVWLRDEFLPMNHVGGVQATVKYAGFVVTIRRALEEHKLAWGLMDDGTVIERDSEAMHADVVVPALTLLRGRPRFADAEAQYRDALNELAGEKWPDAITDANAAVEVALRTIVGFEQGQLPALLDEARRQKIFGDEEDRRLRKFVDGFAALADMRNQESDAHGGSSTRETAWLAVHWAGALLVFIVERAEAIGR